MTCEPRESGIEEALEAALCSDPGNCWLAPLETWCGSLLLWVRYSPLTTWAFWAGDNALDASLYQLETITTWTLYECIEVTAHKQNFTQGLTYAIASLI